MISNLNLKEYKLIKTISEHENHVSKVIILNDLRLSIKTVKRRAFFICFSGY